MASRGTLWLMTQWDILRVLFWAATVLFVCSLTLWRGGRDERLAMSAVVIGWLLTLVAIHFRFARTEWGILAVDIMMLTTFVWIALRSSRYWPIFTAAFQLLAVMTHVASILDQRVEHWTYITAQIIWGYLVVIAVGHGAWTARAHQAPRGEATVAAAGPTRL